MKLNKVQKIEDQIFDLQIQKRMIENADFKKASRHWLSCLNAKFESSTTKTPQYLTFCRIFKKQFSKLLQDNFEIEKLPNPKSQCHFGYSGFFQLKDKRIFYFSIGDLRWSKDFLIRTAKDFSDYTGGINQYCTTDQGIERFIQDLKGVVN